ncbi:EF-hand domain-containing protein [Novosphingobium gossypii]|uniref:EF-hand domain-containing protein n=1 Tax=Novosphingobium gossypii TaxID=1604774 RepID=UPI003D2118C1
MTSMKTLMLSLSAAALAVGGMANAQAPAQAARPAPDRIVTRAEAQARATEMFVRLDVNKDGKLDKADRELRHQQMREKMFARLDTNGDGSISKAEFMADRGPEGRGPGADHDGPPPPPGEGGKLHPRGGPEKFAAKFGGKGRGHFGGHGFGPGGRFDDNRVVTQAEFVAEALKRFDAQDANHDGKVTPEERKARWEARKTADKNATN